MAKCNVVQLRDPGAIASGHNLRIAFSPKVFQSFKGFLVFEFIAECLW